MISYAKWYWRQTAGVRVQILLRILAGLVQVGLGLLLVWLSRRFIDVSIWHDGVAKDISVIFVVVAMLVAARQTVYYLSNMTNAVQQNSIRQRLFGLVMGRKMYADADALHSGDVCQRLEQDVLAVSNVVTEVLPGMVVTLVQLVCAFLLMRFFDAWLAWSLLIATPVVIVCAKYLSHRLKQMTLDIRREESDIQKTIQESVEQSLAVKVLQGERVMTGRVQAMQSRLVGLVRRRVKFTLVSRLLLGLSFSFGYFGAFVYGGIQLRNGMVTVGVMTAFLQLVSQIQNPILTLLGMVPQLMHSSASVDRIWEVESLEQETPVEQSALEVPTANHEPTVALQGIPSMGIRLQQVTYAYPHSQSPILSSFSHDFRPGTSTALLGETGRGKTTLLRIVSGLIIPTQGKVSLYDAHGNEVSGEAMRRHIVYVTQGNTLMSGTIRDNLLLANPHATDGEIHKALHTAVADFVDRLPKGIDTVIGEHAARLSEGQAQRIAIARGLMKEGTVMLLDEISSALDTETERELLSRLSTEYPGRTIVCVTHRPEAARSCGDTLTLE